MTKAIEEIVRDSQKATEPGEMKAGDIVSEGDKDLPALMTTSTLESAGWTYIYDSRTGDKSLCNNNMLAQHLKKKRPDGSYVFTTQKPKVMPKLGTLKCMLHPDNPKRGHYDELGLGTCKKSNLTSPFQVTRHMQKRHKMEWQTLEAERIEAEKQEEREFRKSLMGKAEAPLYVKGEK